MEIIEWWPSLDSDARGWLIAHNGEAVSPEVMNKIVAAGGSNCREAASGGAVGTSPGPATKKPLERPCETVCE